MSLFRGKPKTEPSIESENVEKLRMPKHVAVIMDGNGRWAQARGLPRVEGHRKGANTVRRISEACRELGCLVRQVRLNHFIPRRAPVRLAQRLGEGG